MDSTNERKMHSTVLAAATAPDTAQYSFAEC